MTEELTPRVEALLFPGRVDVIEECLRELEVDLNGVWILVLRRIIGIGHDLLTISHAYRISIGVVPLDNDRYRLGVMYSAEY